MDFQLRYVQECSILTPEWYEGKHCCRRLPYHNFKNIIIMQLLKQIEKPVIDFKESQKKERKEVNIARCFNRLLVFNVCYVYSIRQSWKDLGNKCRH